MYKFISYGLGTIGLEILKALLLKKNFKIVGAVDIKEEYINRDIGDLIGEKKLNILVKKNIEEFEKCDIVIHSTQSKIKETLPQFVELLKGGYNIISTCEELFFPFYFHKNEAIELDKLAKENGVRLLGAGINPGFILDTLPTFISTLSIKPTKIIAERVLDAGKRRKQLQLKVGAGMTKEEFENLKLNNKIGHVGLLESLFYIFNALQLTIKDFKEELYPLIAENDIETEYIRIKKGFVRGQYQKVIGESTNNFEIELKLIMAVGEKESYDKIKIQGFPDLEFEIKGGVQGDLGTAAVVANYIPLLLNSKPGLYITSDLKMPRFYF